jgi:hypothetical protein
MINAPQTSNERDGRVTMALDDYASGTPPRDVLLISRSLDDAQPDVHKKRDSSEAELKGYDRMTVDWKMPLTYGGRLIATSSIRRACTPVHNRGRAMLSAYSRGSTDHGR